MKLLVVLGLLYLIMRPTVALSQEVAILKYNGGGDWYANPTAMPNLIRFCNQNIGTILEERTGQVTGGQQCNIPIPLLAYDRTWQCFFYARGSHQSPYLSPVRRFYTY